MSSRNILAIWALSLLPLASAHGGGMHYIIDGQTHKGNWDQLKNPRSIQRSWDWDAAEPKDLAMACGPPGTPAKESYHAPMKVGSTISVNYTVPEDAPMYRINDQDGWQGLPPRPFTFGHDIGPMNAWMAPCPDEGCEKVDVNAPIWVKIWEAGLLSGDWINGVWAMADVYYGANLDIPTPKSLKSGKYLLRHEMNNLINGGQWFPQCIQLDITGEGSTTLPSEEGVAVAFGVPGERNAYAKDDDVNGSFCRYAEGCSGSSWFFGPTGRQTKYHMPGPLVWQG